MSVVGSYDGRGVWISEQGRSFCRNEEELSGFNLTLLHARIVGLKPDLQVTNQAGVGNQAGLGSTRTVAFVWSMLSVSWNHEIGRTSSARDVHAPPIARAASSASSCVAQSTT